MLHLGSISITSSIHEIGSSLQDGSVTSSEITQFFIERIKQIDPYLNSFITATSDLALASAKRSDRRIKAGRPASPIDGIPVSLKDNICTKNIQTTASSKVLAQHVPSDDATVVRDLKQGGAVILGKTNMYEYAFSGPENEFAGRCRNPWNTDFITGGSSSGSAVSVAASLCMASLGTDTSGSVRIPSSLCGVSGFRPTPGLLDTRGIIPLSWGLDNYGIMTRHVQDIALILDSLISASFHRDLGNGELEKVRIGIPHQYFLDLPSPEIKRAFQNAVKLLEAKGARLMEISIPHSKEARIACNTLIMAEAANYHRENLARYASSYQAETRKNLLRGARTKATDYIQALRVRSYYSRIIGLAFQQGVDIIATPTTPIPAYKFGKKNIRLSDGRTLPSKSTSWLTAPLSLTASPSISIPCGFSSKGLPIGLQLLGRERQDSLVLQVANAYQKWSSWHLKVPTLDSHS